MRKFLSMMIVAGAVVVLCWGCFKDVVGYTIFRIAVYEQALQNGEITKSEDLLSYAYYVDTTEWKVASWEDAQLFRITNKTTGEVKDVPDRIGDFASGDEYQVSMELNKKISMIVVVNPELRMYAYRNYELPVNLAKVDTKLYFSPWKRDHKASGWQIMNPFFGVKEEE